MTRDNVSTAGPEPDDFLGASRSVIVKRLFHATRPKFFPASLLPVIAGSAWGYRAAGSFDAVVFLLALVATLCVHAGANVLNDVGDDAGGTDRRNTDRIYPYTGGSRFIQAGIMSAAEMARLGVSLLAVAATAGLVLLSIKGIMILWFGIAGTALAVLYSLGPLRLSSLGLGEAAVAVAFGVLPVSGAAWLQSGVIDATLIVFSLPVSAWVMAILLINEVPDIDADAATGKRTLPVRIGRRGTALVYLLIHVSAVLAVAWLAVTDALPVAAVVVPILLLALALKAARGIVQGVADRRGMTSGIEATLGIHTLGSVWLVAVVLWVAFTSHA